MFFFVITALLSVFFAYIADKRNKRYLMVLCGICLSLFSGFRSSSVGIDTINYYSDFYAIINNTYVFSKDFGWLFICRQLINLLSEPEYVILLIAVVTNVLIVARLWDFREKSSFTLMVCIYISVFYLQSLNIMRQYLAVSIIFFGTRFLENNRKSIFYFLSLFLATSMHTASIIGIVVYLIKMIVESEHNKKKRNRLILVLIIFIIAFIAVAPYVFSRYVHYFEMTIMEFGLMAPYQLCCIMLALLTVRFSFHNGFSRTKKHEIIPIDKENCYMLLIGIGFSCLGMLVRYMERVGILFQLYQMPIWGQLVLSQKNKVVYRMLAFVFIAYSFITLLVYNGQGIFPYTTFWEIR